MSFALPAVKSKPSPQGEFALKEGSYGVPDVMTNGLSSGQNTGKTHPLMQSELKYRDNMAKMHMALLRNTQGLHAPLRIAMEQKSAKKVGRLPFLASSGVMLESLTGRDIEIDPTDVFNVPEFAETAGSPHAVVERSLGLL